MDYARAPKEELIERPYFVPEKLGDKLWILVTPLDWVLPKALQKQLKLIERIENKHVGGSDYPQSATIYTIPVRYADEVIEYLIQNKYRAEDSAATGNFDVDELITLVEGNITPSNVLYDINRYKGYRKRHDPTDTDDSYQQKLVLARRRTRPEINDRLAELSKEQIKLLAERRRRELATFYLEPRSKVVAVELALRGIYDSVDAINEDVREPDENDKIINKLTRSKLVAIAELIDPDRTEGRGYVGEIREYVRYNYTKLDPEEQERWGLIPTKPASKAKRTQGAKIAAEDTERRRLAQLEADRKEAEDREMKRKEKYLPDLVSLLPTPKEGVRFRTAAYWDDPKTGVREERLVTALARKENPIRGRPLEGQLIDWLNAWDNDRLYKDDLSRVQTTNIYRIPGSLLYTDLYSRRGVKSGSWHINLAPYIFERFREKMQPQLSAVRSDLGQALGRDMAGYVLAFL